MTARKRRTKKEKAKAVAHVSNKAKDTEALRELGKQGKEINKVLERAKVADGRADDLRLTAAMKMAEAEKYCVDKGIQFKKWAEANIEYGYENVRKLVAIGKSENPAQALQDLRDGVKKAAAKSRAKSKSKPVGKDAGSRNTTPLSRFDDAFEELGDEAGMEVLKGKAEKQGFKLITQERLDEMKDEGARDEPVAEHSTMMSAEEIIAAFDGLKASGKLKVLEHAAKVTGRKLVELEKGEMPPIPDDLKRSKGKRTRRTAPATEAHAAT